MKNPKYKANKKNGGIIPAISDERVKYVPVGCQDCMECRKQKARGWQIRLSHDIKKHRNGKFITLTFSNESIRKIVRTLGKDAMKGYDLDNQIATYAVRHWLERWRKKYGKSLRHWLVTELGHNGTENIHIHGIIWTDETWENVVEKWTYGYVWPREAKDRKKNYVSTKTVNYIIKYVTKADEKHRYYKSIILTSAGIGRNYTEGAEFKRHAYTRGHTREYYRTDSGHKVAMPIYWRNKAWTDEEREKLWLEKLDKYERWVCGEKIDISKTESEYYRLLEWHRERNKRLGYGDGTRNWEQEQYERERRILMMKKRIKIEN